MKTGDDKKCTRIISEVISSVSPKNEERDSWRLEQEKVSSHRGSTCLFIKFQDLMSRAKKISRPQLHFFLFLVLGRSNCFRILLTHKSYSSHILRGRKKVIPSFFPLYQQRRSSRQRRIEESFGSLRGERGRVDNCNLCLSEGIIKFSPITQLISSQFIEMDREQESQEQ